MLMTSGFLIQLLAFLSAVVSISPSLENLHDLCLLIVTRPESLLGVFLCRCCLLERMTHLVIVDLLCKQIH